MSIASQTTDHTIVGPIVHEGDLKGMTAGADLARFNLVYIDTDGTVKPHDGTATKFAVGIVDRAYTSGDTHVSVLILNDDRVLAMVANGAVNVGAGVMSAASGKVAPWAFDGTVDVTQNGTSPYAVTAASLHSTPKRVLGVAMTAAANDGDVIQVLNL